jgi:hypothetical protein
VSDTTGEPIGELSDAGATRWTEARLTALETVAAGKVTKSPPLKGESHFMVSGYWQKPRQGPYIWLAENCFIRIRETNPCWMPVSLTATGQLHLTSTKDTA